MRNFYINIKKQMLFALFVIVSLSAFSQTQFNIVPSAGVAGNTNGTGGDPVCRYYNSIRFQVVYTVAELNAAGMTGASQISSLAWNVTESSVSLGNYTINMGNTLDVNSAAHNVDATTTVKNPFTYNVVLGYNDIVFDTPFIWNGTNNLVIEICTGAANPFTSPYGGVQANTGVASGSRQYRVDGSSACGVPTSGVLTTKPYVRLTGNLLPATPPTPTQSVGIPSCATGTNLDLAGPAPVNETWYWQTTPLGTSMVNPYVGPYTVFSNGTYYARSYNSTTLLWSSASSSYTVSNFPIATSPVSPVSTMNPSCSPAGSTLTIASAPANTEYYWQGTTLNGTSNALNASSPYAYTTSGTYYVSAYDLISSCWSNTVSISVTVDNVIPATPIVGTPVFNYCSGVGTAPITATVPVLMGTYTCNTSGTASGVDQSNPTAVITNFSCPTGTVTSASLNANLTYFGTPGYCASFGWFNFDVVVNGTVVATNICDQTAFNLTPYLPLTNVTIIAHDGDAFADNIVVNATVTLSYTAPNPVQPAYSLTWYNAPAAGSSVGTGSPLEALGTSVMPTATFGSYPFYVGTTLGGCSSATRQLVTVNMTNVNAVLTPVNELCNGGNTGSFTLGAVQCGTAPFLYSVNGGAFGPIPTNLIAGTYTIVMQDVTLLQSAPISVVITQPAAPAGLATTQINYFTADVTWTTTGNETQWNVEYGPAGFTPGTGTTIVANTTSATLTGLSADTDYDFYVTAVCGTNATPAGPSSFSTNPGFFTYDNACGPGFIDISATGTNLNLTDDSNAGITLPWAWTVNGTTVSTINVGNNGSVQFNTLAGFIGYNAVPNGFSVFSQDLNTPNGGVYWESQGVAPNRQFIIMWQDVPHWPATSGDATFEAIVDEATGDVFYVYSDVIMDGPTHDFGADAEIACNVTPVTNVVSMNSATYLTNNSCVHFYNALCPNATNVTSMLFPDEVILNWSAGAYGETSWTVIYGPAGFDPLTSGTTITVGGPFADITGLSQLTDYDFYIYSECQLDNLTSSGLLVSVQTLPWCSNPSGILTATAVDSLFSSWNFTASGPLYPATGFNLEYGMFGFSQGSGTLVVADANNTDTTANSAFLAGGVYELYVQAVCGTDTSNYQGPFTFVMPLSNDSVCGAEMLQVDGTVYIFDNTGATVQTGEGGIIPMGTFPAGYNGTDLPVMTWGSSVADASNWYTFVAPASGSLRFSGQDEDFFASQIAIYELTDCADFNTFTLVAASDQTDVTISTKIAPNFTICGLTPGATYYVLHDAWSNGGPGIEGQYSIKMTPIVLQAGSNGSLLTNCTGDTTNLFNSITGYDAGGVWTAVLASANTQVTDSLFASSGLAYQTFNFQYRMTDGCAYDSIISQVQVYPLSSAGIDGSISVCRNQPVDLLSGLSGTIDLGGTWYNPSNAAMPSSAITASNIPGAFNYDYITGNGVCPDDTSNVLVTVNPACNYLDVQELVFGSMSLFPNPTNGVLYITNEGSSDVFNYTVTDVDGRVVATKEGAINGTSTTEINLKGKVTGMYLIRVYNDNAEKVFRVILQ